MQVNRKSNYFGGNIKNDLKGEPVIEGRPVGSGMGQRDQ